MNSPDETTLIERTLFFDESRSLPSDDPNLNVRRLPTDQWRYHARYASKPDTPETKVSMSWLYVVVGDELEVTALREDCSFIINRTILETEDQAGDLPIAVDHLEEITHRKHAAIFRTQREKAMDGSLHTPHGYGLRWRTLLQDTDQ